jgi:hypothetical protein
VQRGYDAFYFVDSTLREGKEWIAFREHFCW